MTQPVHFIAHFTVTDADRYRQYEKGFFPVLKDYDAEFLTYDDDVMVLEGERAPGRTVVIRFASEEECLRWWHSDEYRAIVPHRHAGTETFSVSIVHAPPARG